MGVTDPRRRYDDLLQRESRETLPPDEFEATAASEAATVGWVAFALAFDDAGRVLLIDQSWADGWTAPGGTVEPGETLAEAVEREVREETGVEITPRRPHAVDDFTFENEATGATGGWRAVLFEAAAETMTIGETLGHDDHEAEEITDARWFDGLPENVFNPEVTREVYRRSAPVDEPG